MHSSTTYTQLATDTHADPQHDIVSSVDLFRARRDHLQRRRRLSALSAQGNWLTKLYVLFDAGSAWIIVFLIGAATAINAGIIDIGVRWLSDIRTGYCDGRFYLSKEICCRNADVDFVAHSCARWIPWGAGNYAVQFLIYVLLSVLFAMLAAFLVRVYAPFAAGSGLPECKVLTAGWNLHGFLGLWTLLIKSIGLMLSVGSGLSLGKEGPLVHIAAAFANVFTRIPAFHKFLNPDKRRELLSAAAAAGVAAAFGAPVGGIAFVMDEVASYFPKKTMFRAFFAACASVLVQRLVSSGSTILFQVNYHSPWRWFELPVFLLLGALGGALGALFIKANAAWCSVRTRTRLGSHPVLDVLAVATATAILNFVNPFTRNMSTSELIAALFRECDPRINAELCSSSDMANIALLLLLAAFARFVLTIVTFGLRVPAGLFVPSLAIGACIGRVVGLLMDFLTLNNPDAPYFAECDNTSACVTPGIYALIGAAAMLGGVTRMTISLVIIIVELTGNIDNVAPVMFAIMTSKWVADFVGGPEGIYDVHIRLKRYSYLDNKELDVLDEAYDCHARDLMSDHNLQVIESHSNTVASLHKLLRACSFKGVPVVNSFTDMAVVGYVRVDELRTFLLDHTAAGNSRDTPVTFDHHEPSSPSSSSSSSSNPTSPSLDASHLLDRQPICLDPSLPVERLYDMFVKLGLQYVLITRVGKLKGIVTKKDLLRWVDTYSKHKQESYHSDIGFLYFLWTSIPSLTAASEVDDDNDTKTQ